MRTEPGGRQHILGMCAQDVAHRAGALSAHSVGMESSKAGTTTTQDDDQAPATAPACARRRSPSAPLPVGLNFPAFTARLSWNAKSVARQLRGGAIVSDESFDEVFPQAVRHISEVHWTPVEVAVRAARLLAPTRSSRLLDVGAGAGKFCLVAAAATGAGVCGVERSPYLASVAREAARRMEVSIDIRDGSFECEDPSTFDGIYLFNPFTESLYVPGVVPALFEHEESRSQTDVRRAEEFLLGARVGARVATFCGFGAPMPKPYERMLREERGGGVLEVWTKMDAK